MVSEAENGQFCKEKRAVTFPLERLRQTTRKITAIYQIGATSFFEHFTASKSQYHSIPVYSEHHTLEKLFNNIHIFI